MAVTNVYKVHYHFENNGKKASPDYFDYISAAANDFNSLQAVLSNDGKILGSGKLQITSVSNVGITGILA